MEESPGPKNGFKCCSMCMRHCFETHGDFGRIEAEELVAAPSFFSHIKSTKSKFLRIPVLFMEKHNCNIGDMLCLKGPSGFECEAAVERHDDDYAMKTGFDQFVEHHKVEAGDSLFFTLIAKSTFLVKIYDKCGTERTAHSTKGKNHRNRPYTSERLKKDLKKKIEPIQGEGEQQLNTSTPVESNRRDHCKQPEPSFNQPAGKSTQERITPKEDCMAHQDPSVLTLVLEGGYMEHRAAVEAAKADRTVEIIIKDTSSAYTAFPEEFGNLYLKAATSVQLENTNGDQWSTNYIHTTSRLQGGWKKFVEGNRLEEGDICLLKLVNPHSPVLFKVQFFRFADFQHHGLKSDRKLQVSLEKGYRSNGGINAVDIQQAGCSSSKKEEHLSPASCEDSLTVAEVFARSGPGQKRKLPGTPEAFSRGKNGHVPDSELKGRPPVVNTANAFLQKLKNPSQLVTMADSHVTNHFTVYLPKLPLPKLESILTLLDSTGEQYTVKWAVSTQSRARLSTGWKQFAEDHKLLKGDVCIFEATGKLLVTVHIFRLADYPKPSEAWECHGVKEEDIASAKLASTSAGLRQRAESVSKSRKLGKGR